MEAASARAFAGACGGDFEDVLGGCAAYCGAGSPLTHAVGLGIALGLTASEWDSEIDRMERYFQRHDAAPNLEVSSLADFHLLELLTARGYRPFEWNHVLWRKLERGEWLPPNSKIEVRLATDAEEWSRDLARGFFERDEISAAEARIGIPLFQAPGARAYTAFVEGAVAGSGALGIYEGVALFHADSTLVRYRGRGVQAALIRARLIDAIAGGAWLATAATSPGSMSQRNYERQAFHVLYARLGLAREV